MAKRFLCVCNRLFTTLIVLSLTVAILYSGYALWDNRQIYAVAETVMEEAQNIKAYTDVEAMALEQSEENETQETELQAMFLQLKEINPDICAWVFMQGTKIDYPVVHSSNNIEYVSTDIYGNFAIVGSIFLDFRNNDDNTDLYNLLYGHNMSEHRMFSDVNLYKDEDFFKENQQGAYYTPNGSHWLQTISVFITTASNSWLMNPRSWQDIQAEKILELVQNDALFVSEEGLNALKAKIKAEKPLHIVALSTCSNEFTDARTILLTLMDPEWDTDETETEISQEVPDETTEEQPEEASAEVQ